VAAEYLALSSQIFENDLREFIVLKVSMKDLDKLNFMKIGFRLKLVFNIAPLQKSKSLSYCVDDYIYEQSTILPNVITSPNLQRG